YEQREFSKVITEIRDLTDLSNRYFDEKSPWKTLESHPRETKEVLTATLNLFRTLTILVTPILPEFSKKVSELFGEESYLWSDLSK
ncbi:class I tRNA ligase family protein, partial [Lacticaseibacillus paracasei]